MQTMRPENELALIIGYYLSRFDREGHELLGYESFNAAVRDIGIKLSVNKNTVKNMRDEFDPYHQNNRVGWKDRKLSPSRERVLKAFSDTDQDTMVEIVKEILNNNEFKKTPEYRDIHVLFAERPGTIKGTGDYLQRGATGKAAEAHFMAMHASKDFPLEGQLKDCRDLGCGYDFEVRGENGILYVEVKGLTGETGGISFTNKEWQTAKRYGDSYYLAIIANLSKSPALRLILNPYSALSPRKNLFTTLQVSWNVSGPELDNLSNRSN